MNKCVPSRDDHHSTSKCDALGSADHCCCNVNNGLMACHVCAQLAIRSVEVLFGVIAAGILNRMRPQGWKAFITCPAETVTSMNGVTVQAEKPLEFATQADAVLIGSGMKTRDIAKDAALLAQIEVAPKIRTGC